MGVEREPFTKSKQEKVKSRTLRLVELEVLRDCCLGSYSLEWRPQADTMQSGTRTGQSALKVK
jgi:hypothetical protein